jgi:hypothetical protein
MNEELLELIEYFHGGDKDYLVGVLKRNDPVEMEGAIYMANEVMGGRNDRRY